jgi:hypothetical protein
MSVPLAIAVNVLADLALLGGLAWVMTRPRRLTPHLDTTAPAPTPELRTRRPTAPRRTLRARLDSLTAVG